MNTRSGCQSVQRATASAPSLAMVSSMFSDCSILRSTSWLVLLSSAASTRILRFGGGAARGGAAVIPSSASRRLARVTGAGSIGRPLASAAALAAGIARRRQHQDRQRLGAFRQALRHLGDAEIGEFGRGDDEAEIVGEFGQRRQPVLGQPHRQPHRAPASPPARRHAGGRARPAARCAAPAAAAAPLPAPPAARGGSRRPSPRPARCRPRCRRPSASPAAR